MKLIAFILISAAAHGQTTGEFLRLGATAYNNGDPESAVGHFRKAVAADPRAPLPRLHLAYALATGASSQDERERATQAIEAYKGLLAIQPRNEAAIWGAGVVLLKAGNAPGALAHCRELRKLNPAHSEALYLTGVIAWMIPFRAMQQAGVKLAEPGPLRDDALRRRLAAEHSALILEGRQSLERLIAADARRHDAMDFLNLIYRNEARLADSDEEYRQRHVLADEWITKSRAVGREPRPNVRIDPAVPPPLVPGPPPPPPPPPRA